MKKFPTIEGETLKVFLSVRFYQAVCDAFEVGFNTNTTRVTAP